MKVGIEFWSPAAGGVFDLWSPDAPAGYSALTIQPPRIPEIGWMTFLAGRTVDRSDVPSAFEVMKIDGMGSLIIAAPLPVARGLPEGLALTERIRLELGLPLPYEIVPDRPLSAEPDAHTFETLKLNLPYPPIPENMPRLADEAVSAAREIDGVTLDYTPESLARVDQLLSGFQAQNVSVSRIKNTLFIFGCYVGEVMVRSRAARWAEVASVNQNETGTALVVRFPNGLDVNPIGMVFESMAAREHDAAQHLWRATVKA